MKRKTEIIMKAICIVILVALLVAIYINGRGLKCENCIVKFYKTFPGQSESYEVEYRVIDLYNNLTQGQCPFVLGI